MKQIPLKKGFKKVEVCYKCSMCCYGHCNELGKKVVAHKMDKDCPLQEWGEGQWVNTKDELPHPKEWVEVVFTGMVYIAQFNEKADDWQIENVEYTIMKEAIKKWRRIILPLEAK